MQVELLLLGISALIFSVGISSYFISLAITNSRVVFGQRVTNESKVSIQDEEEAVNDLVKAIQSQNSFIEMDARIERMKMELADKNKRNDSSSIAIELHPLVKNLPHDSINGHGGFDAEDEIAD